MKRITTVLALLIALAGCKEGAKDQMDYLRSLSARLEAIPRERWESLSHKRIYFGHKSVGQNIIAGLEEVMREYPAIKLDIQETANPAAFARPLFAHSMLGTNKFPEGKIDGFREIMESGVGQAADIAFFKLCFVDIDHTSDLQDIFNSYVKTLEKLRTLFPSVKFITFTVPLVSQPVGWMPRLKKLLGRMLWYEADHIQRSLYNGMLREKFKSSLFDLAAIESRISDTQKATITEAGKRYDILHRGYTDDGGHLNPLGRRIVAIELLCYLAETSGE